LVVSCILYSDESIHDAKDQKQICFCRPIKFCWDTFQVSEVSIDHLILPKWGSFDCSLDFLFFAFISWLKPTKQIYISWASAYSVWWLVRGFLWLQPWIYYCWSCYWYNCKTSNQANCGNYNLRGTNSLLLLRYTCNWPMLLCSAQLLLTGSDHERFCYCAMNERFVLFW
jgi:hypothetical protein